jgi:hypothetical protein
MSSDTQAVVDYLLSPQAIRDRSQILFGLACRDQLDHFHCNLDRLPAAADYVIQVMQAQYPDGDIPFHSRWRHFEVDGTSRLELMEPQLSRMDALERARLKVDLAIVSVLLDAGAGERWRYTEPLTGREFRRSEGLAIASFHSFYAGLFSSHPHNPWQANVEGLSNLTAEALAQAFQVSTHNPLVGVEGRTVLLQKLGQVLSQHPDYFGAANARPGHLVDYWLLKAPSNGLSAEQMLTTVLHSLGSIWPGRTRLNDINLGDVWSHPKLPGHYPEEQLVPFHKLSQWLTYSLLEPVQDLGLRIAGLDSLTGLAEYRNGGLLIDAGVLVPKHAAVAGQRHTPDSPVIVEWRALTVILLDRLAEQIRQQLGLTIPDLPLPKVLQGGTWAAGRQIAREKRAGGEPPVQLASDGTVF